MRGQVDNQKIYQNLFSLLGKELKSTIKTFGAILVVIVIHSVIKSIGDGLENKSVSQITYYAQYILIVTLVMTNFSEIIVLVKNSVGDLVGFINCLLPILITLMITTGSVVSASMVQPVLLFIITFIGNMVINLLLPITLISTALGIVSKVSDKIQIDRIAKFFKSSVIWILGIVLTLFVGILSLEGTLTSNVDGVTAKTTKAAVSSLIPVVGKVLGDAVDSVMGCASVLKSAVGIVGVVVIIGICILPIIKLAILTITYNLASAACQPVADEKIVSLLGQMSDTFKVLLAIMVSVSVLLIIGVALVVRISNAGMMYR